MKTTWMLRVGVTMTVLLLNATLAQAQSNELLVSHVQAALDPQTAEVDVWYRLDTVDDGPVTVSLFLSTDSGATYPYLCATVSGDVGVGVLPGTGKHIVWDAGADFPGLSSSTCRLRVTADDGRADFVEIPPGTFMMGSPTTEYGHWDGETQHQVTLTHGLYMQTTEVTNQQYRDMAQWAYDNGYVTTDGGRLYDNLDGSNQLLKYLGAEHIEITFSAGVFTCITPAHPVLYVTWYGAAAYCDWLSLKQGLPRAYNHSTWECNGGNPYTAAGYRLPTEAEWEYACRAGTQTPFNTGSCLDADTEAIYNGSYPYTGCPSGPPGYRTVPVGSYPANAFGFYDMHGNVMEWCNDWYGSYGGIVTDPVGAGEGFNRVMRGGDWQSVASSCRSAGRMSADPSGVSDLGFRVVRSSSVLPQVGTITINPEPNSINAPWQITGPDGFTGSAYGDTTLTNMAAGSYTLTWNPVTGWTTPSPAAVTQPLAANGTLTITGEYIEDIPVGFVSIPAGTFTMGSPTTEVGHDDHGDETQHQVTLTHSFYMQATEVTNQQYMDMAQWAYNNGYVTATISGLYDKLGGSTETLLDLGSADSEMTFRSGVFSCINPSHPVLWVTWYGSVAYCDWLSLQQGLTRAYDHSTWQCNAGSPYTATGYRLPTEAEWEYACRAGTQTPFNTGSCLDAGTEANYYGPSPYTGCPSGPYAGWTVPVGSYPVNAFGLYDMHGNLFEWCNDWYEPYGGTVTDPLGAGTGSSRVYRGGSCSYPAGFCRSAFRYRNDPRGAGNYLGFRVARSSAS